MRLRNDASASGRARGIRSNSGAACHAASKSKQMSEATERLKRNLAAHLPDGDKITGIRQLTAGHSNETYLVEGLNKVLRTRIEDDLLVDGLGIKEQYEIYTRVSSLPSAPPVPAVSELCEDTSVTGAPFFLMDFVEGTALSESNLEEWVRTSPVDQQKDISTAFTICAGEISRLPVLDMLGPVLSPTEECGKYLDIAKAADNRELVDLIEDVLKTKPAVSGPPSLVHGDLKWPNTIWNDTRLAALLDWELAFNGEPLCDLGYYLSVVGLGGEIATHQGIEHGILTRAQMIDIWEETSARTAQDVAWYETYGAIKPAAIIAQGAYLAESGRSDDPRFVAWNSPEWKSMMIGFVRACAEKI